MLDPIATLTMLTGETATLILQPEAAYNPHNSADFVQAEPLSLDVRLVYQKAPETGPATSRTAKVMFTDNPFLAPNTAFQFKQVGDAAVVMNGATVVGRVQADQTKLLSRGTTYIVKVARARFYLGVMNGFTMELQR